MAKAKVIIPDALVARAMPDFADRLLEQLAAVEKQRPRTKVTLEIDDELLEIVQAVAAAWGISPTSLANCLLLEALLSYCEGQVDIEPYLQPSRSPRYAWTVEINTETLQEAMRTAADRG